MSDEPQPKVMHDYVEEHTDVCGACGLPPSSSCHYWNEHDEGRT